MVKQIEAFMPFLEKRAQKTKTFLDPFGPFWAFLNGQSFLRLELRTLLTRKPF